MSMSKIDPSNEQPLPYMDDGPFWETREAYFINRNCCQAKPKPEQIPALRKKLFEDNDDPDYCVSESTNNNLQMATIAIAIINVIINVVLVVYSFHISNVCLADRIFVILWLSFNLFILMLYAIYRLSDSCCGNPKMAPSTQFRLSMIALISSSCSLQIFFQGVCQVSPSVCALSSWALINPRPENFVVKGLYATCFSLNGAVLIMTIVCMSCWWSRAKAIALRAGAKKIPLELRDFFVSTYPQLQLEMVDKYTGYCGGYYTLRMRFSREINPGVHCCPGAGHSLLTQA